MKYFIIALVLFIGCSSSITEIKDKKIEITIPIVKDSIPAVVKHVEPAVQKKIDSLYSTAPAAVIEGEKDVPIKGKPTKIKIKYHPIEKSFDLEIDEHKVDTTITDTTKIIIKKETTTVEKFGYAVYGIIAFVVILCVIVGFIIYKKKVL